MRSETIKTGAARAPIAFFRDVAARRLDVDAEGAVTRPRPNDLDQGEGR